MKIDMDYKNGNFNVINKKTKELLKVFNKDDGVVEIREECLVIRNNNAEQYFHLVIDDKLVEKIQYKTVQQINDNLNIFVFKKAKGFCDFYIIKDFNFVLLIEDYEFTLYSGQHTYSFFKDKNNKNYISFFIIDSLELFDIDNKIFIIRKLKDYNEAKLFIQDKEFVGKAEDFNDVFIVQSSLTNKFNLCQKEKLLLPKDIETIDRYFYTKNNFFINIDSDNWFDLVNKKYITFGSYFGNYRVIFENSLPVYIMKFNNIGFYIYDENCVLVKTYKKFEILTGMSTQVNYACFDNKEGALFKNGMQNKICTLPLLDNIINSKFNFVYKDIKGFINYFNFDCKEITTRNTFIDINMPNNVLVDINRKPFYLVEDKLYGINELELNKIDVIYNELFYILGSCLLTKQEIITLIENFNRNIFNNRAKVIIGAQESRVLGKRIYFTQLLTEEEFSEIIILLNGSPNRNYIEFPHSYPKKDASNIINKIKRNEIRSFLTKFKIKEKALFETDLFKIWGD